MDVWKYEIISRVEQDISLIHFAPSWDILVNTQNKFHIFAHPCIILCLFHSGGLQFSGLHKLNPVTYTLL